MPWMVNVSPQKYTSAVAAQCRVHRATIAAIQAKSHSCNGNDLLNSKSPGSSCSTCIGTVKHGISSA